MPRAGCPLVVLTLLLSLAQAHAQDAPPRERPTRREGPDVAAERDRMLDLAQYYRGKASALRQRANDLYQANKVEDGQQLDDRADALDRRARELEENADALESAQTGGLHEQGRSKRRTVPGVFGD